MNRKGNIISLIWIGIVLFVLLFLGIGLAFGTIVLDWTFDEAVPELTGLGMVGSSNMTEIADITITPTNTIVQAFIWMAGVFYVLALIGCIALAFSFRFTGSKWLMSFFILMMFILIIASIFISNIYQDFYSDSGEVGTRLHELDMLSWLILYSPLVISIIGFICGIIMFTGEGGEEGF